MKVRNWSTTRVKHPERKLKFKMAEDLNRRSRELNSRLKSLSAFAPMLRDIEASALLKIEDYFEKKYKDVTIPAKKVSKDLPSSHKPFSVRDFIEYRVAQNVHKIESFRGISYLDVQPGVLGFFSDRFRAIGIFRVKLTSYSTQKLIGVKPGDYVFGNTDYLNALEEHLLIHEFIHAISKCDQSIGFSRFNINLNINEGITENLASEISFEDDVYFFEEILLKDKVYGYYARSAFPMALETNMAGLLRIAGGEDFDLQYLINANEISLSRDKSWLYKVDEVVDDKIDPYIAFLSYKLEQLYTLVDKDESRQKVMAFLKDAQDKMIFDIVNNSPFSTLSCPGQLYRNYKTQHYLNDNQFIELSKIQEFNAPKESYTSEIEYR